MIKKLSKDKEQLVLDNQSLVHYLVQKNFGLNQNDQNYLDVISIGKIGLVKAAITFDYSKKNKFSTYASKCILNEIYMNYRKSKKYASDVSIDDVIKSDENGNDITLGEILAHPDSNFVERIINKERIIQLISIIINYLKGKERIVTLYKMGGLRQELIAQKINVTQSYVSRIASNVIKKIKKVDVSDEKYMEVFSVNMSEGKYMVTFSPKDVPCFNKILANFYKKLSLTENIPDYSIDCNKERITFEITADSEAFLLIANIIEEIDNFSIGYSSVKSNLTKDDTATEKKMVSKCEKNSKYDKLIDYILCRDIFSISDLRNEFPNLTVQVINNYLHRAKKQGIITNVARGKYVVNKK